ncbi:MAG: glutathione S-transferase family protein [Rhodospirillaceae bacterium]|nr:glutathione S-transferase family protein [Rhodospirillaceae bacterium]
MGFLLDGVWHDDGATTKTEGGKFVRKDSGFRNWVTVDGRAGPSGKGGFKAEAGRYLLYVSWACPWAHRTLIFRKLKGLERHVGLCAVHWRMHEDGWAFYDGDGVIPDPVNNAAFMREIYTAAMPNYSGRVTVPVLWDKQLNTIVSNESSEIIRMFNSTFDGLDGVDAAIDFYPEALRSEVDIVNERVYRAVNNGVYKAGFASTQDAYDEAVVDLFEAFDWLEARLASQRYLVGEHITEADWRLWVTLIRFDPVYHGHFKCNIRQIIDYPNLWNFTKELYQWPGVAETTNHVHIKSHYYGSHRTVNPTLIIPIGPDIDFDEPHDRRRLPAAA